MRYGESEYGASRYGSDESPSASGEITSETHLEARVTNHEQELDVGLESGTVVDATVTDRATVRGSYALSLDGESGYVDVPTAALAGMETGGTFTVWIRGTFSQLGAGDQRFFGSQSSAGNQSEFRTYKDGWIMGNGSTTAGAYLSGALPDDEWVLFHVGWDYDAVADETTTYVGRDGTWLQTTSLPETPVMPDIGFTVGKWGNDFTSVDLDDARVYDRRLSEAELQQVMVGEQLGDERAHYRFDEGAGSVAADSAGPHNATINGGAAYITDASPASAGDPVGLPPVSSAISTPTATAQVTARDHIGTGSAMVSTATLSSTVTVPTFYTQQPDLVESVVHEADTDQRERLEAFLKAPFQSPRGPDGDGSFDDTEFGHFVAAAAEFGQGMRYMQEELLRQQYIDTARRKGLDEIGDFVGIYRKTGERDPPYRARIKAGFRGLLGGATLEEVIEITADLLDAGVNEIDIREPFTTDTARIDVTIPQSVADTAPVSEEGFIELILMYRAAGIEITFGFGHRFTYRSLADYYDDINDPEKAYSNAPYRSTATNE